VNRKKDRGFEGRSNGHAWGSQIRSYVFCPFTLVKDHRTILKWGC
jgi:peptide chain release factor 2